MFFLFGWGRQTKDNLGPALPLKCPSCNNQTVWELMHSKVWFTLFFIPVIPYESDHLLLCKVCSKGLKLKGSQIEKAKKMNQLCKSYESNQISQEQFAAEFGSIDLMEDEKAQAGGTKAIYTEKNGMKAKLCGACETQNNPSLNQCWKCGAQFAN